MNEQAAIFIWKKNFFAFYIQPGQILENIFFQMIFLAVLNENTVQCPKMYFYVFIDLHFSNCKR